MRIRSKAGLQKTATAWGNPAEKWLGYFTLKGGVLGKLFESSIEALIPTAKYRQIEQS